MDQKRMQWKNLTDLKNYWDNNMKKYKIPTGYIITDTYSKEYQLETLSIGDYGKDKNIKAPFLGFNNDINGVPNGDILPLSVKWVITLSSQYGCPMKCSFCDVPSVGYKGNATFGDMLHQIINALNCFPDVKYTDRLNIHFARMGEPSFNSDVLRLSESLYNDRRSFQSITGKRFEVIHPVVSTMCPKTGNTFDFIKKWVNIKNELYKGQAGLQISVNSTNENQRNDMFKGLSFSLKDISENLKYLPDPVGRKYCLNFALASGYEVDAKKLRGLFDPEKWMVKITPIHNNTACKTNNIETHDGYMSFTPYKQAENDLQNAGYDTIVFVPSWDEENGCVTCGNAILGQSELRL
ncbi:MAG: Fe-S-oxidoreductase [archaeon]